MNSKDFDYPQSQNETLKQNQINDLSNMEDDCIPYCGSYLRGLKDLDFNQLVAQDVKQRSDQLVGFYIDSLLSYKNYQCASFSFNIIKAIDDDQKEIKIIMIKAPIFKSSDKKLFWYLVNTQGYIPMGIQSYGNFPLIDAKKLSALDPKFVNSMDRDMQEIIKRVEGWLYVVRDPLEYFGNKPRILLPNSDFEFYRMSNYFNGRLNSNVEKIYDIVFVVKFDKPHFRHFKNWDLAMKSLEKIADETNLTILFIGSGNLTNSLQGKVTQINFLDQDEFYDALKSSRILFVPSIEDASPRIISQALALDVPVVVNRQIIGGWHYVNQETGSFFQDQNDIIPAIYDVLQKQQNGQLKVSEWYKQYVNDAPKRLQSFVEILQKLRDS